MTRLTSILVPWPCQNFHVTCTASTQDLLIALCNAQRARSCSAGIQIMTLYIYTLLIAFVYAIWLHKTKLLRALKACDHLFPTLNTIDTLFIKKGRITHFHNWLCCFTRASRVGYMVVHNHRNICRGRTS